MKRLWAGRFEKELDVTAEKMEFSVYDNFLIEEDIWATEAHNIMLWKQGIITKTEAKKILTTLEKLKKEKFVISPKFDDVHLNIEQKVINKIGINVGGKLHTGRSRNDQRAVDLRLATRKQVLEISNVLIEFIKTLLYLAEKNFGVVMPGYTHTQQAEAITVGFWLSSFVESFLTDLKRLSDCYGRISLNPLGAAALAGTSWNIDRNFTSQLLGFDGLVENSLYAVSSRDWLAEYTSVLSILASNLSRLSEDLILFSTQEFGYIEFSDKFATGSSIMPHKKNPDFVELARAHFGKIYSNLLFVLTTLKGIPSGYNRDFQEINSAVFDPVNELKMILQVYRGMLETMKFNKDIMRKGVEDSFCGSVELANYLVKNSSLSFRESHFLVGVLVNYLIRRNKTLKDLDAATFKKFAKKKLKRNIEISESDLVKVVSSKNVYSKKSRGSTNPNEVKSMIKKYSELVNVAVKNTNAKMKNIEKAKTLTRTYIRKISAK